MLSSQVHNQNEKKPRAIIESVVLQLLEFANIPCLFFTVCGWIVAFPGLVFMPPKELWEAYSNRTGRLSRFVSGAYPIFFEVGIPNLVCGCILGWRSVPYHFRVNVTLTLA